MKIRGLEKINAEDEYKRIVKEYYQIYRALQKKYDLRERSHFDLRGGNCIEVWEYRDGTEEKCICQIKDEEAIGCYKRTIEVLQKYKKKKEEIEQGTNIAVAV